MAVISIAISIPFLLICPIEYLGFPLYYLLGVKGGNSAGISVWHFLERGGILLPGSLGFIVTLSSIAFAWFYVHKKQLDIWRAATLVTAAFFAVYPMMHLGYYLIIFAFFAVWAAGDLMIAIRSIMMYIPFLFSVGFSDNVTGSPLFNQSWGWIAGLICTIAGTILLLDTTRVVLKKESFLDRNRNAYRVVTENSRPKWERGPDLHS